MCETPPGLTLVRDGFVPSVAEQAQLDKVLDEYVDVLSPEPGRTDALKLSINTGVHDPVRKHPYRIPPRWKEKVRVQIDKLLELGIIRPSDSPWSSSIVTVGKKDGGVRICIDFRAINNVTQPDPYQPSFPQSVKHPCNMCTMLLPCRAKDRYVIDVNLRHVFVIM